MENYKIIEDGLIPVMENNKGKKLVDARLLHEFLEVGTKFADWIKERIEKYKFSKDVDFTSFNRSIKSANTYINTKEYILTLNTAKQICHSERNNPKSSEILQFLYKVDNNIAPIIKQESRYETKFGDMLEKITGFKWYKQYPIDGGKYRLDFYLPNTLIIEYDEKYHKNKSEKDNERILYCREWLENNEGEYSDWRCPVIRVKQGDELEGLNKIIRHLAGFEKFDTQYNYKLQVCDYGNR